MRKTQNFNNYTKPFLVGGAPFSGFYTGFYFVPLYALEQMYHGVSKDSRYFSFNYLVKTNNPSLSKRSTASGLFYPEPNLHFSKLFFHYYVRDWLEGQGEIFGRKPKTFFYNFLLGIFFFIVWQLGGGFRLSPLHDPRKRLHVFGFYDLRLTPLATIFKFFVKLNFFLDFLAKSDFLTIIFLTKDLLHVDFWSRI